MGDRIRANRGIRAIQAVLWTAFLCGFIVIFDRACIPEKIKGWVLAASIKDVPEAIRFQEIPTYLPAPLRWPPTRIYYQTEPEAGWWYGIGEEMEGRGVALWMGAGGPPYPADLAPYAPCLDMDVTNCPEKWHVFSTRLTNGRVLFLLGRIDPEQLKKILTALEVSAH